MNEKIKELWSQAGGNYDSGNQHTWPQYTIDNPEKFTELIVKECAKVAQDFVTVENNKLVEEIHISPWHLQDKIKEHFGVSE